MIDDFEAVRKVLRLANDRGIDSPGFSFAALRRIEEALARATLRVEEAEAAADDAENRYDDLLSRVGGTL